MARTSPTDAARAAAERRSSRSAGAAWYLGALASTVISDETHEGQGATVDRNPGEAA